ncbi:hypothetical protein KF201_2132 [Lactococcus lactis subsp. lactis]|nr:hypothetical protein KF201_2132 [Lactococcus lactis subsp. lactis]
MIKKLVSFFFSQFGRNEKTDSSIFTDSSKLNILSVNFQIFFTDSSK